jgi:hypothetical protein
MKSVHRPLQLAVLSAYVQTTSFLLVVFASVCSPPVWAQLSITSSRTPAPLFEFAGSAFRLDPSLLQAIAMVESAGRLDAVSPKGASGLMQLMPDTARRFGVRHPLDPVENVVGAARFLSYLLEHAGIEDLPELLAAYNAGEGAVARYDGLPPYPETREYVRRVLWAYLLDQPATTTLASPPLTGWRAPQHTTSADSARLSSRRPRRTTTDLDVLERLGELRRARSRALMQTANASKSNASNSRER